MKFRLTIGLIIQGPLLTYGQGPNNIIEGFNCLDVIAGTISAAQKHGIVHCVSTWHPQSLHENALLQQLLLTEANVLLLDPPILDPDHRQKHHYGIRAGITEIEANYIIKVRTDMVIPDAFWDWVKSNAESNTFREKLLVSELYTPFYLGDFIYATSRRNMIRFLDSVLAYGTEVLHPSVTTDIGFKYFVSITNNHLRVIDILFSYFFYQKKLVDQWATFVQVNINVLPEEIFRNINWRGKKTETVIPVSAFKFDVSRAYSPMDIKFLLDEYLRYFSKRHDFRRSLILIALRIYKYSSSISKISKKFSLLFHGLR